MQNVSHFPTISFMHHVHMLSIASSHASAVIHMWINEEFIGFQIKKTTLCECGIRGESQQRIAPWFRAPYLKIISL